MKKIVALTLTLIAMSAHAQPSHISDPVDMRTLLTQPMITQPAHFESSDALASVPDSILAAARIVTLKNTIVDDIVAARQDVLDLERDAAEGGGLDSYGWMSANTMFDTPKSNWPTNRKIYGDMTARLEEVQKLAKQLPAVNINAIHQFIDSAMMRASSAMQDIRHQPTKGSHKL